MCRLLLFCGPDNFSYAQNFCLDLMNFTSNSIWTLDKSKRSWALQFISFHDYNGVFFTEFFDRYSRISTNNANKKSENTFLECNLNNSLRQPGNPQLSLISRHSKRSLASQIHQLQKHSTFMPTKCFLLNKQP